MELHEFITATLVDIQRGVHNAIEIAKTEKFSGVINPIWGGAQNAGPGNAQKVEFDIAVSGSEKVSGEAEAGIKVLGIGLGGKGTVADENSKVSRIKFVVPVIPPMTIVNR